MKTTLIFTLAASCVSIPCFAGTSDVSRAISEALKSYVIEQQVSKNTAQFDACLKNISEQSITVLKKTTHLEAIEQRDKNRLVICNKIIDSPLRAFSRENEQNITRYVRDHSKKFVQCAELLDMYTEEVKKNKPRIIEWFAQISVIENKIHCLKKINAMLMRSAFSSDAEFQQAHDVHAESINMLECKYKKQFMRISEIVDNIRLTFSTNRFRKPRKTVCSVAECEKVTKRAFYHLLGEKTALVESILQQFKDNK